MKGGVRAPGGVYFRFRAGRTGTSAANVRYITRETGTRSEPEAVYAHNYPEHAREGATYDELRANLVEYARQAEQDELERPRRGGRGSPQTHFRAIASCKGREETDRVLGMAREYRSGASPTRAPSWPSTRTGRTPTPISTSRRATWTATSSASRARNGRTSTASGRSSTSASSAGGWPPSTSGGSRRPRSTSASALWPIWRAGSRGWRSRIAPTAARARRRRADDAS